MTTFLDRLKSDHATFQQLISNYEAEPDGLSIGASMTLGIYRGILKDGLSVLVSLIEFLERQ